jgi:hypothetical protein
MNCIRTPKQLDRIKYALGREDEVCSSNSCSNYCSSLVNLSAIDRPY